MEKDSATVSLPKYLIPLLVSSIFLSLVAVVLSVISLTRPVAQIAETNTAQLAQASDTITTDQASSTSRMVTYTNNDLGLSFDYPTGYRVSESNEVRNFDQGKILSVTVFDEDNSVAFMAQATSSDYAVGVSEGCCYYFTGFLDTNKSVTDMSSVVEGQLREIFAPYRADVGGRDSLGFFYANDFVTTNVVAAHITPIDNEIYSNVFFTSGALYSEEGTYDEKIDDVQNIFNLDDLKMGDDFYPELDSEKQRIYNDIISTVTWK